LIARRYAVRKVVREAEAVSPAVAAVVAFPEAGASLEAIGAAPPEILKSLFWFA
jgi:hypothetical protein